MEGTATSGEIIRTPVLKDQAPDQETNLAVEQEQLSELDGGKGSFIDIFWGSDRSDKRVVQGGLLGAPLMISDEPRYLLRIGDEFFLTLPEAPYTGTTELKEFLDRWYSEGPIYRHLARLIVNGKGLSYDRFTNPPELRVPESIDEMARKERMLYWAHSGSTVRLQPIGRENLPEMISELPTAMGDAVEAERRAKDSLLSVETLERKSDESIQLWKSVYRRKRDFNPELKAWLPIIGDSVVGFFEIEFVDQFESGTLAVPTIRVGDDVVVDNLSQHSYLITEPFEVKKVVKFGRDYWFRRYLIVTPDGFFAIDVDDRAKSQDNLPLEIALEHRGLIRRQVAKAKKTIVTGVAKNRDLQQGPRRTVEYGYIDPYMYQGMLIDSHGDGLLIFPDPMKIRGKNGERNDPTYVRCNYFRTRLMDPDDVADRLFLEEALSTLLDRTVERKKLREEEKNQKIINQAVAKTKEEVRHEVEENMRRQLAEMVIGDRD